MAEINETRKSASRLRRKWRWESAETSMRFLCLLVLVSCSLQALSDDSSASTLERAKNKYYSGDLSEAKTIFLSLSPQYDADAYYYLAMIQKERPEMGQDTVIEYLIRSAHNGNSLAMWELGQAYENGRGVPENPLLAMDWYRAAKCAEKDVNDSVTYYSENNGLLTETPASEVTAAVKVRAESGDVEAQYALASMYDVGGVLGVDNEEALNWYQQAAKNGHSYSQYVLGYMHCRGIGVDPDVDLANYWLIESGRTARCGQH